MRRGKQTTPRARVEMMAASLTWIRAPGAAQMLLGLASLAGSGDGRVPTRALSYLRFRLEKRRGICLTRG